MTLLPKHPEAHELYCIAGQTNFQGNRFEAAEKIISWLVADDIIKPEKCIVRYQQNGHRFSEGMKRVVTEPLPDIASDYVGLEYVTERRIYCFQPVFDYALCPYCQGDIENCPEQENFLREAIFRWEDRNDVDFLQCPICKKTVYFHELEFGHTCAFSDLAFTFFGCHGITETFQTEFEQHLGCPIHLHTWWPRL